MGVGRGLVGPADRVALCRDGSERPHNRPPAASIERRSMTCRPMASIGISPV